MSGIALALIPTFIFIGEQALQVLLVPQHVMIVLFIPAPLWRQRETEVHVTGVHNVASSVTPPISESYTYLQQQEAAFDAKTLNPKP